MPSVTTAPTASSGTTGATSPQLRPATDPICQNRKASRVSWLVTSTPFVSDASPALSAAPARASLTGVAPSRPRLATA